MDNEQFQKLIGFQRAEFALAAKLQSCVIRLEIILMLVSCAAIFVTSDQVLYFLSLVSLLVAFLWGYCDYRHKSTRSVAEKARRATLFMGALGFTLSEHEYREIQMQFTATAAAAKKNADSTFFAAKQPSGLDRLAEMLEEAAFWSSHLLKYSARRYWWLTVSSAGLLVVLLVALVPFIPKHAVAIMGKVVCAILATLVSVDVLGRALLYSDGAEAVKCIQLRLQTFKASGNKELGEILIIAADYNSAVETAPMFAGGLYEKHRDKLNALWKGR
jgi:hypothetical protein